MRTRLTGSICMLIAACMLVYATPHVGAAMMDGDVKKELQTALYRAGELAPKGNAVTASKLHLQHVINCIEGPTGANFKKEAGYPCAGRGNGIMQDLAIAAAQRAAGQKVPGNIAKAVRETDLARTLALQAVAKNDVSEVQPWAKVVSQHLKASLDALES